MAEPKKTSDEKTSAATKEIPEPVMTGPVIPENEWEDHARYMREVVNPDNT